MKETIEPKSLVLVVEDEPLVQLIAVDILESAGYSVRAADDAASAMAILEQDPDIDILFTDVRMPGAMDGRELAWSACQRWPHLRIILTSGHAPGGFANIPAGATFLPKPYRPGALEKLLRDVTSIRE